MHHMILFVLDDASLTNELLAAWHTVGVPGATILESTGLGRLSQSGLRDDTSIMPSLRNFYRSGELNHRTIFTIVKDDAIVPEILKATETVVGSLSEPNTGLLLVLPVAQVYGNTNYAETLND